MRALALRGRADFVARRRIDEILILIFFYLCIFVFLLSFVLVSQT